MTEEPSADDAVDSGDAEEGADEGTEEGTVERGAEGAEEVEDGELAPGRREGAPDVEAAKAELEAVGAADEDGEGDDEKDDESLDDEENEERDAESPLDGEEASVDEEPPDEQSSDEESPDEQSPGEESQDEQPSDETTPEPAGDSADGAAAGDVAADEDRTDDAGAGEEPRPEDLVRDPDEPQVQSSLEEAAEDEPETTTEGAGAEADSPDDAAAADVESAESESAAEPTEADATEAPSEAAESADEPDAEPDHQPGVPEDVRKYDRFKKVDGSQYDRVNEFLRDRTYVTAREWAIARLCSDFRTETGVEMTKIGENLPELVPFMTDTYTPQAVNQARASFEDKVRTAGATFLYGAMCDFFTAEELDDVMYEATEVAKFLLEVEGVELSVEEELEAEDRISAVMREVRSSSAELRHERCPDCGAELSGGE